MFTNCLKASITHTNSGIVTGTGSSWPPWNWGCRNICGNFLCRPEIVQKCKVWFWKSLFWKNLGAKLKILAPIISSVGNLQLYIRFLSSIGPLFNPRISCLEKKTTGKNGWQFFRLYITLLKRRACLAVAAPRRVQGGMPPFEAWPPFEFHRQNKMQSMDN